MNINSKRILALVNLGLHIKNYSYNDPKYSKLDNCIEKSIILNKWFTRESITNALKSWAYTLESKNIEKSAEIKEFGRPKPSQNPAKTPSKSTSQKTCNFSSTLVQFCMLVAKADP